MSRRKKKIQGEEKEHNEWLQTYADTITLILTFFVLLYSYSSIDTIKFQKMSMSLQSILSGKSSSSILELNSSGEVPIVGSPVEAEKNQSQSSKREAIYKKVKGFIDSNKLKDTIDVKKDSRGIIMELKDNILFDVGKADIKETSKPILDKINLLIKTFPNDIIVEGHTDNVPIHTDKYPSNWELSTQRAVNVLKYFVQIKGQNPKRFQAAGYGEYRPIAPNNNYVNRTQNRRVNILIVGEKETK